MGIRRYAVKLDGVRPLLMHQDNIEWSETMKAWEKDPANKKISVKGDDRSPAWRWIGNLYHDSGFVVMPSDNLMTLLREGGALCPTGASQGKKTFKAQTQSGILVDTVAWDIVGPKGKIAVDPVMALIENNDFRAHEAAARDLGFELFSKRAKIGSAKHVRVRPRFDAWSCEGTLSVLDDMITTEVLQNILTFAGRYCGLGDWRPSSPKSPGSFGQFAATIKEI